MLFNTLCSYVYSLGLEGVFTVTHLDWLIVETNTTGFFSCRQTSFSHRLHTNTQSVQTLAAVCFPTQCHGVVWDKTQLPHYYTILHSVGHLNLIQKDFQWINNRKVQLLQPVLCIWRTSTSGADTGTRVESICFHLKPDKCLLMQQIRYITKIIMFLVLFDGYLLTKLEDRKPAMLPATKVSNTRKKKCDLSTCSHWHDIIWLKGSEKLCSLGLVFVRTGQSRSGQVIFCN